MTYFKQNQYALVPRCDRNGHLTTMRTCYAISSSRSIAGWIRTPPAVVRIARTRRQYDRTDDTSGNTISGNRVTVSFVAVYRVTVINWRRLVGYDHWSTWSVVLGLHSNNILWFIRVERICIQYITWNPKVPADRPLGKRQLNGNKSGKVKKRFDS